MVKQKFLVKVKETYQFTLLVDRESESEVKFNVLSKSELGHMRYELCVFRIILY